MSEKLAEVYEQYDMEILSSQKGRGATILNTTDGLRILEPFRGNITRLEQEYVLKCLLLSHDCNNVDAIIKNEDGQLLSYDKYRQPYVMRVHFEGRECDMHEKEDIVRSIHTLAKFHICGKNVASEFGMEWKKHLEEKEEHRIEEIKHAIENGEELEKLASLYEISESALNRILNTENKDEKILPDSKSKSDKKNGSEVTGNGTEQLFIRHTREIKKIYKFIRNVKKKNEFEKIYLKVYSSFYQKALQCLELLSSMPCNKRNETNDCINSHFGICHGCFNQHNIILGEQIDAIVHFEKFSRGNQLLDLYQFARKVMEKNHFDREYLDLIFNGYQDYIPMSEADFQYIYILFSYPEKFWKIANSYYNTNKAFLSPKYIEKLQTVILQEEEKQEMLKGLKKNLSFSSN